ncbi:MAG: hypothetical protein AAF705_06830, partial [Bacteroidota bacterium]
INQRTFANYNTESNLLNLKAYQNYDLLIMGISHARNFSRHKNHQRIEQILNKRIINLGQGNGVCGVNEQLFYLDYFYHKENKSQKLVYFISPPLFFSGALALSTNTFDHEPFEWDFFRRYRNFPAEQHQERMVSYLQSKYNPRWLLNKPFSLDRMDEQMMGIDSVVVKAGFRQAYGAALNMERFAQSTKQFKATIELALAHQTEVILVIPPALFGKWDGHQEVAAFAQELAKSEMVSYYDFSEAVLEPQYYYDHHHLNTDGVVFFTEEYLKPVVL